MNWSTARVKDLAWIVNGFPFDSSHFADSGEIPLVRIRDIVGSRFETWLSREVVPDLAVIKNGDLVIGMDGDFNSTLWNRGEAALNQRLCLLRARHDTDIRFLSYALPRHLQRINDLTYSTTVKHLSSRQVANVQLPSPPLHLQRLIADYLDRETAQIDTLIAKQERLIVGLQERKKAVVAGAVTRGITTPVSLSNSGVPWLGNVPAHWTIRPLWSLFTRIKDISHPDEQMLSVFREFGVVVKDEHDNLNKTADNRNIYQLVHPGWLVANRMKAWQGSVGISRHRGIVSGHYICFAPRHSESSSYLNWLFRSAPYTAGYRFISRGVRIGQAEIDNDDFRVLPVLVPPHNEQRAIAAYLDEQSAKIDALIAKTQQFIALAKERRAALITAAVTGQIDVSTGKTRAA